MSESDITTMSNQIKEVFTCALEREGFITKEQREDIDANYTVVLSRKGWLGEKWDKIRGVDNKSGLVINIVKDVLKIYDKKEKEKECEGTLDSTTEPAADQ